MLVMIKPSWKLLNSLGILVAWHSFAHWSKCFLMLFTIHNSLYSIWSRPFTLYLLSPPSGIICVSAISWPSNWHYQIFEKIFNTSEKDGTYINSSLGKPLANESCLMILLFPLPLLFALCPVRSNTDMLSFRRSCEVNSTVRLVNCSDTCEFIFCHLWISSVDRSCDIRD